jgi:hypothetical protein
MRLKLPHIVNLVALCCSGTIAVAQLSTNPLPPPPVFPPCEQSMIQGNWALNITLYSVLAEELGFFPTFFASCTSTIDGEGDLTTTNICPNNLNAGLSVSGTLMVNTACQATGNLSLPLVYGPTLNTTINFSQVLLWMSADGSRWSGYGRGTGGYANLDLIFTPPAP